MINTVGLESDQTIKGPKPDNFFDLVRKGDLVTLSSSELFKFLQLKQHLSP